MNAPAMITTLCAQVGLALAIKVSAVAKASKATAVEESEE